jgi:hypothetical protein
MNLVQILLPLYDNAQQPFDHSLFERVERELTETFGGLTAYKQTPAVGFWKADENETTKDRVVVYEVMVPETDRAWWSDYRRQLEARFRQESIVVRAQTIELL